MSYPKGWDEVSLSDLCLEPFANGITLTQESMGHGAKLVNIVDLYESHTINIHTLGRANASQQQLKKSELKKGDIVFVRSSVKREGAAMCACFPGDKEPVVFGCFNIRFRPHPKLVDSEFLTLFLRSPQGRTRLLNVCQTATITNINQDNLGLVKVPLPPLAEQKRIAAIAQKADRLRRTRRYALQLSDTYLRSVFLEMFGDYLHSGEVCELDDVITTSPSNGLYKSEEFLGSGVLFLDIKCLYRGFSVDFSEPRRVQITEKEQKKYEVFSGDILINRVSKKTEGVGKAVLVINVKEPTVYESNMMRFRVNPSKVQPWFLIYYLASEVSRRELLSKANISNQASINQETLKSLKLPLPPLPLQEKFAQIVQKFDRLRTQQWEAEHQAEHLFQTLLHRAFWGELTSQKADDEPESVLLEEIRVQQAKAEAKAKTATQARGEAADYLGTKAKQQDIEPIQLKFPGFE